MARPRTICASESGVIISVRFSRDIIELLDLIVERDHLANRSTLLREAAYNEISVRIGDKDGA